MQGEPDGKIINNSFSTRAPRINASQLRLLWYDAGLGCFGKLALYLFLFSAGFFALGWYIPSGLFAVFALLMTIFTALLVRNAKSISENALLCPGVVVSESPLRILVMAEMGTGLTEDTLLALKVLEFEKLPCHAGRLGEIIPFVSSFTPGKEPHRWADFAPDPISFATGNLQSIQECLSRFDADELTILNRHYRENKYPEKPNELMWLEPIKNNKNSAQG